jgi:DNA-binding NtrC family response regulator
VIHRLGDATPRRVDVRLIAATNRDLRAEVAAGRFRRDLYHRIAVTTLTIPPLRDRAGDVDVLAAHFLDVLGARHGLPDRRLTPAALAALRAHSWPGNVRELRNAIETALLTAAGRDLGVADLPDDVRGTEAPPETADPTRLATAERTTIEHVVAGCRGNLAEAARQLGIARSTLYRKLERYGGRF